MLLLLRFLRFLRFFGKSKKCDFLRFFALLHTFSRTMPGIHVSSNIRFIRIFMGIRWTRGRQMRVGSSKNCHFASFACCIFSKPSHLRPHFLLVALQWHQNRWPWMTLNGHFALKSVLSVHFWPCRYFHSSIFSRPTETLDLEWRYRDRDDTETFKKRPETVSRSRRSRPRLQPCWILNIVLKCQRDSAPYTEACIRWEEQWTQHAIPQSMRCLYPCFAPDKKSIARDVPRSAVCTAADCRRQTYSLTCRRRQCQKPNHEKPNVQKADTAKRKERERNKSRVVAGKPREAVQISICKASGELHTEDIAIDRENSHFRWPHSYLTPPHQRTPTNIGIKLTRSIIIQILVMGSERQAHDITECPSRSSNVIDFGINRRLKGQKSTFSLPHSYSG